MNIRPAHRSDALSIATAHMLAWREAYSHILPAEFLAGLSIPDRAGRWEQIISAGESSTFVAEVGNEALAFSSYGRCRDAEAPPSRGEIWALYATPSCWRKGMGRALLQHAIADLTSQGYAETSLWVLSANERGRLFYEANGFAKVPGSEKPFELGGVQVLELQYLHRNAAQPFLQADPPSAFRLSQTLVPPIFSLFKSCIFKTHSPL